jgi:hypothetical protein
VTATPAIPRLHDAIRSWGSDAAERAAQYPCDGSVAAPDEVLFRAVTVDAPPAVVFRWLCQLRVAPYSYDWIDNLGRRSPRHLIPGLEDLAVGQRVMTIFTLSAFEADRHITVHADHRLFGEIGVTYRVAPQGRGSRLVAKLRVRYPRSLAGVVGRRVLPVGDLVMMRRQLRTLRDLAEGSVAASAPPP